MGIGGASDPDEWLELDYEKAKHLDDQP